MPAPAALLDLYLHLARASEEQSRVLQRDKFLVLAAGTALEAGFPKIAEDCRNKILAHNPNHILRGFSSMRDAAASEDIRQYSSQLLRIYPFEKAEYLLHKFRASGYRGNHGYAELTAVLKAAANAAIERKQGRRAEPDASGPKPQKGSKGPRANLKRAMENRNQSDESPGETSEESTPLPLGAFADCSTPSVPLGTFLCWLVFAFALGMAAGGFVVWYFFPGS